MTFKALEPPYGVILGVGLSAIQIKRKLEWPPLTFIVNKYVFRLIRGDATENFVLFEHQVLKTYEWLGLV